MDQYSTRQRSHSKLPSQPGQRHHPNKQGAPRLPASPNSERLAAARCDSQSCGEQAPTRDEPSSLPIFTPYSLPFPLPTDHTTIHSGEICVNPDAAPQRSTQGAPATSRGSRLMHKANSTRIYFVIVFSDLAACLLDLCNQLATIRIVREVLPIEQKLAGCSIGKLKTYSTKNESIEREEWMVILKKLINAVAPSAQPFRMTGKGLPGRGSGPRLTDRRYYK